MLSLAMPAARMAGPDTEQAGRNVARGRLERRRLHQGRSSPREPAVMPKRSLRATTKGSDPISKSVTEG